MFGFSIAGHIYLPRGSRKFRNDRWGTTLLLLPRSDELNTVLFQKWKKDLDREFLTVSWLDYTCEKVKGNTVVSKLKCKVCGEFEDRIKGRKNSAINGLLEQIQLG